VEPGGEKRLMIPLLAGTALFPLGGILALFFGSRRKGPVFAGLALAAQALVLPPVLNVLAGGPPQVLIIPFAFPIGPAALRLDPLAAFFVLIISLGGALAAVYSTGYMKMFADDRPALSGYYFFLGLLIASMTLVVTVQNTLLFLMVWEIMSLASFFLVGFEHRKDEVRRAAVSYLIAMQVGAAFLLAGFAWAWTLTGSLDFASLGSALAAPSAASIGLFLLFLIGFGTKAGLVPLHTWLPQAHPAAPTGVSAVMSGVMIKTGIYGILRLVLLGGTPHRALAYTVLIVSLMTGVFGVMNAIAQHDIKRLLAYHSIENIGIIGIGIGLGMIGLSSGQETLAVFGFFGALLHVFNHFTFKSLLFYGAGIVYMKTHTRDIDRLGGLVRTLPVTSSLFLIGSLAICGLPLLNGFISEFALFSGLARGLAVGGASLRTAILGGLAGLAFIGVMAVLCFTKVFGIAFLGSPRAPRPEPMKEGPAVVLAPMFVLAAFILVIGLASPLVLPLLGPVTRQFVPGGGPAAWADLTSLFNILSPAMAEFGGLIVFFLTVRWLLLRRRTVTVFKTWDCGYQAESPRLQYTASSFASPFLRLIAPLVPMRLRFHPPRELFPGPTAFESHGADIVESGLIRPLTEAVRRFLGLFTWIQSGQTQNYILYGIVFLIVLIVWIMGVR
jgi:hydrogenase-4 component B